VLFDTFSKTFQITNHDPTDNHNILIKLYYLASRGTYQVSSSTSTFDFLDVLYHQWKQDVEQVKSVRQSAKTSNSNSVQTSSIAGTSARNKRTFYIMLRVSFAKAICVRGLFGEQYCGSFIYHVVLQTMLGLYQAVMTGNGIC
jgi:hypothetical protein